MATTLLQTLLHSINVTFKYLSQWRHFVHLRIRFDGCMYPSTQFYRSHPPTQDGAINAMTIPESGVLSHVKRVVSIHTVALPVNPHSPSVLFPPSQRCRPHSPTESDQK